MSLRVVLTAGTTALAIGLVLVAAPATEAGQARASFSIVDVLAEPAFTKGTENVIRWSSTSFDPSHSDKGYLVTATDVANGQTRSVAVDWAKTSAVVPNLTNAHTYEYVVRARSRPCNQVSFGSPSTCLDRGSLRSTPPSVPVTSTQDATPPSGTIAIEAGAPYTNRLAVIVQVAASDPGARSSGLGYVELAETPSFPCAIVALSCARSYAPQLPFTLTSGPDGPRTVHARFYDRARGAAAPATPSLFERRPPGNVSGPTSDTILLDTTGPTLLLIRSAEPAMMNVPVSFDASGSRDQAGFGADSGLDAGTAVWDFGDATRASGLAVSHTYREAGTFNANLAIRDRAGNESRLAFVVTVSPTSPGAGTTTTGTPTQNRPTADTTAPGLSRVRLVRRARIAFSLSEPATVFLEIRRLRPRPVVALLSARRAGRAGSNVLSFAVRVRRQLARPGRYRILLAARDGAGNASRVRTITVRRGKR